MTKADLIAQINLLILTGGNRTSALNARTVLTNMVQFLEDETTAAFGIAARSGGGQALATILTTKYSRIDGAAADGDSIIVPSAIAGAEYFVQNYSGFAVDCFANGGDNFINQAALTAFRIASGNQLRLYCYVTGEWTIV